MFLMFIGATELCKIHGLSAAGASPEVIPFTAPADADVVRYGIPKVVDAIPLDPEGRPTPALITRASYVESQFPLLIVRAGTWLPPSPPYIELGCNPGEDPQVGQAVPDARNIFRRSLEWGRVMGAVSPSPFVIGESVPGGTTTALLILRALGYSGMVSSAGAANPVTIKEQVCRQVFSRCRIGFGDGIGHGLDIVAEMGDPMQAAVAGFVAGLPDTSEIVLAGGCQMLAVAALLKDMGIKRKVTVATTCYVQRDPSACFDSLSEAIGVDTWTASLNFSHSAFQGLSDYECGYVKEGVGAGGSVWYAEKKGIHVNTVIDRTEKIYAEWLSKIKK